MASGSFNLSSSKERVRVWANWWEQDTNIENNTSVVGVAVYLRRENNGYTTYGTTNTVVNVDGQTLSEEGLYFSNNGTSDTLLFSKTYIVLHNDDGSKSVTIDISLGGNIITGSGTTTVQLDTIARASQITISKSTFNVGENITVYTNQKSDSFTHYLYLRRADGLYYDPVATGIVGSYNINNDIINDIIYNQSTNSDKYEAYFLLRTYNGNTAIGDTVAKFTALIENCNPTFEAVAYTQTNEATKTLTGNDMDIVSGQSAIQVEFSGDTAYNYASISKYIVYCGGTAFESDTSTVTVDKVENDSISCWIVDSRGLKSEIKTISFNNFYDYSTPKVTMPSISRLDSDWTKVKLSFKLYSPQILIYKSAVSVKCAIALSDSSQFEYFDLENPESTDTYYSTQLEKSFEIDKNYIIKFVVNDSYGEYTYGNILLQTAEPELSIRKDRVGINCIPIEGNGMLQIGGKNIFDLIYPVGCYYWSAQATDPSILFGGTWERVIDKFILAGGKYASWSETFVLQEEYNSSSITVKHDVNHLSGYISGDTSNCGFKLIHISFANGLQEIEYDVSLDENNCFEVWINSEVCIDDLFFWVKDNDKNQNYSINSTLEYVVEGYPIGEIGGSADIILKTENLPKSIGLPYSNISGGADSAIFGDSIYATSCTISGYVPIHIESTLEQPVDNMPPYEVAYCWKRIE